MSDEHTTKSDIETETGNTFPQDEVGQLLPIPGCGCLHCELLRAFHYVRDHSDDPDNIEMAAASGIRLVASCIAQGLISTTPPSKRH